MTKRMIEFWKADMEPSDMLSVALEVGALSHLELVLRIQRAHLSRSLMSRPESTTEIAPTGYDPDANLSTVREGSQDFQIVEEALFGEDGSKMAQYFIDGFDVGGWTRKSLLYSPLHRRITEGKDEKDDVTSEELPDNVIVLFPDGPPERPHLRETSRIDSEPGVITPQLKEAIKRLEESHQEMTEELQRELLENPMLEESHEQDDSDLKILAGENVISTQVKEFSTSDEDAYPHSNTAEFKHRNQDYLSEIPDVILNEVGDAWHLKVNFENSLKRAVKNYEGSFKFLSNYQRREAEWLLRCVALRESILLKVTTSVLELNCYFTKSHSIEQPLSNTLSQVAEDTKIPASVISWVASNKVISTPKGPVNLKALLTAD